MSEGGMAKGRILLVDDNEDFLDSTKDVLEEEDYDVVTASSGEEAVRRIGEQSFDVVVMDIKMPGISGVESLVEMRKISPSIKVIMCTAYIIDSLIRQALAEGAYTVLNKPFKIQLLLHTIENCRQEHARGVILLADHDREFSAELVSILRGQGHTVLPAYDGDHAVEIGERHPFDILVAEMTLPGIRGLELHRRLRANRPSMRATVLLGGNQELSSTFQRTLKSEHGVITFPKPLDVTRLLDLLATICAARKP
jgi:two-component system, NtrC family, response regulator HydG